MSSFMFESQPSSSASSSDFTIVSITNANSPYAASYGEYVLCDTSGGTITVTAPTATGNSGKRFVVQKTTSDFTAVTITGLTTLNTINEDVTFVSNGSANFIYERRVPSLWVSYTPTGDWVANTTYTGFWKRSGDSISLIIRAICSGAPTSATFTADLPSGLTIDTAKLVTTEAGASPTLGTATARNAATSNDPCIIYYNTTTDIILRTTASGAAVTQAAPFTFGNNDYITLTTNEIPITNWNG